MLQSNYILVQKHRLVQANYILVQEHKQAQGDCNLVLGARLVLESILALVDDRQELEHCKLARVDGMLLLVGDKLQLVLGQGLDKPIHQHFDLALQVNNILRIHQIHLPTSLL